MSKSNTIRFIECVQMTKLPLFLKSREHLFLNTTKMLFHKKISILQKDYLFDLLHARLMNRIEVCLKYSVSVQAADEPI